MANDRQVAAGKPKTARLPLMGAMSNRDATTNKDQRFLNIFPETRKVDQLENTKIFLNKRPGLVEACNHSSAEFFWHYSRGICYYNNYYYYAHGSSVYKSPVSIPSSSSVAVLTLTNTINTPVGMLVANSSVLGDYLFITDGEAAWTVETDGTVTQIKNDNVNTITLTNSGNGYGSVPTVTISAPPLGTTATATATVSGGVVTGITITDSGSGYISPPTVTIGVAERTFVPSTDVNTSTETITITNHTYGVGNAVVYTNGTGSSIGGLTDGKTYYIIVVDTNTIKLASSLSNAQAGTAVALSTPTDTATHKLAGTRATATIGSLNYLPIPHIPVPVFIDGYIGLAAGSDLYTCDLDNPHKWSAENFLSAEMFPDRIVSLARQNNQVVVFGENSTEFFYDAANVSGSPLTRNDSTAIQIGCACPYAVYQNEQFCIFVSNSASGGTAVWKLDGFTPKKISDEYVERIIDSETSLETATGYGLRIKGHLFYVLTLPNLHRTFVYDLDEKLWHEWSSGSTEFRGKYMCTPEAGTIVFQDRDSGGYLSYFKTTEYSDLGDPIKCEIVTNKYDMDTYNRKFMHAVRLVGDVESTAVRLRWSDDDYSTWSNEKVITMNDSYPAFHRLGAFRRRAFKLTHELETPLRLESLECVYNEGTY